MLVGGGGWGGERAGVTQKNFGRGCAALHTPHIHIISRLTKHTDPYNLHVKKYPIHIIIASYGN